MTLSKQLLGTAAGLFLLAGCSKTSPALITEYLKDQQAAVFVFLGTDCPISQNYTRTLNDLRMQFQKNGIEFYAVFAGETDVSDFIETYNITFPVLLDGDFRLADFFGAMITPEVFMVDAKGQILYTGAIDNWAPELGQRRTVITEHYVLDALNYFVDGRDIPVKQTEAVGCFIERTTSS